MKRGGPLRADPEKAKAWRRRAKRVKQVSDKRRAGGPARRAVVAAAIESSGHCVLINERRAGPCHGKLTPHRLRKGSAGWDRRTAGYVEGNVVMACSFHNGWIETFPLLAEELGMVVR